MILAPQQCGCTPVIEGASIENSPICGGTILFMTLLQGFLWGQCDIAEPCKRIVSEEKIEKEYDFIVVGAGSAGSIVAGRLAESGKNTVLVLEAGGPMPIGAKVPSFYRTFWANQEVDWDYHTTPGNYCLDKGNMGCTWSRGKVLGGTSALNGMMYHRCHKPDFGNWVVAGAKGWSWEENLKYYDMTEGNRQIGSVVSEKYHSGCGPLPVQHYNYQPPQLLILKEAVTEAGMDIIDDMNNPETPVGFTVAQAFNENGQRCTTSRAFLKSKSEMPNLSVKLYAHATRVIFKGKRAVAVEFIDTKTQKTYTVRASKEVILSAGALNSPHILIHSGVGPATTLKRFNIRVVKDLPVGQNLRNHIGVTLSFVLSSIDNVRVLDWASTAEYLLTRKGPMSSDGLTQFTGLQYSSMADRAGGQPDLQFFFNGLYAECSRNGQPGELVSNCHPKGMNVSANAVYLLPKSVGYQTINSTNPLDAPIFEANYFDHPDDMRGVKEGVEVLKKIFETKILQEKYQIKLDPEYSSVCDVKAEQWSDEWQECIIRYRTDPQNHQQGTAAIGTVLDTELRVKGLKGIRVIDASAMPTLVTGNPQAPIMMVAERGAANILKKYGQ